MKFATQIALAIVAVVGLVAGITYVSQFYTRRSSSPPGEPKPSGAVTLTFPVKIMTWDPPTLGEFEVHAPGHQDFWFINKNSVPVDLGLMTKSCKCSEIKACVLTAEQGKRLQQDAAMEAAAQTACAQRGIPGLLAQLVQGRDAAPDLQGLKLKWEKLEPQMMTGMMQPGNALTVPPQGTGLVRFDWDGKTTKEGPDRLGIELWTQAREGKATARDYVKLELPVTFVRPLRVSPPGAVVDELGPREVKTTQFVCWSPTRASFTLSVRPSSPDPCFSCDWVPLSAAECARLSEGEKSRVLAGFRVSITVRERTEDGKQLDIGPFGKHIVLSSDATEEPTNFGVLGVVVGDFTVGADEDKGKVLLESFPARTGTSKEIVILARQPGVGLRTDQVRIEPSNFDHLKASVKPDGAGRWRLLVRVLPGGPPGKLPQEVAVVLKMTGEPPRQLRVPIRGLAYQR